MIDRDRARTELESWIRPSNSNQLEDIRSVSDEWTNE